MLHLLRIVLEGRGVSPWEGKGDVVPVIMEFGTKVSLDEKEQNEGGLLNEDSP